MSDKKLGFTLIELIVILALIMVVAGAGSSLLVFGKNTFTRSEVASNVHYEVRMLSDFIREELRYAKNVEISTTTGSLVKSVGVFYINVETNGTSTTIRYYDGLNDPVVKIFFNIQTFDFDMQLDDISKNNSISYSITTIPEKFGEKTFSVTNTVLLNNVRNLEGAAGKTIKYKKPVVVVP